MKIRNLSRILALGSAFGLVLSGPAIVSAASSTIEGSSVVQTSAKKNPKKKKCAKLKPKADLSKCDLSSKNLAGKKLSGAKFAKANLDDVNFTGADLRDANFSGASLNGANLGSARIAGAAFGSADLAGVASGNVDGKAKSLPAGWKSVNGYLVGPKASLAGSDLAGTDLSGMNLQGTKLRGADLDGANLDGVQMNSASSLEAVSAVGTTFKKAKLLGAVLTNTKIFDADFTEADISQAKLNPVRAHGALFVKVNVAGTEFSGSDFNLVTAEELKGIPASAPKDFACNGTAENCDSFKFAPISASLKWNDAPICKSAAPGAPCEPFMINTSNGAEVMSYAKILGDPRDNPNVPIQFGVNRPLRNVGTPTEPIVNAFRMTPKSPVNVYLEKPPNPLAVGNGICGANPDPANAGLYKCKIPNDWETSLTLKDRFGAYGTVANNIVKQVRVFGFGKPTPDPTVPDRWTIDLIFPHNTAPVLLFGIMGIPECDAGYVDSNGTYAALYDTGKFGTKPNAWYPGGSGGEKPDAGYAPGTDGKPDFSKPYFTSCPMKGGDVVGTFTFDGLTWD